MVRMFQKRSYRKPDEQIIQRGPVNFSDGPVEHVCAICGRPACFGFGVHLLKDQLGIWACPDHRNEVRTTWRGK